MLLDSMDKDMDMSMGMGMGRMVLDEKMLHLVTLQQNHLIIQPQMVRRRRIYLHDDVVQRNDVACVYLLFVSVLPYTTSYATNT